MSDIVQEASTSSFDSGQQLAVYRAMLTARRVDELEFELTNRGEVFFHVSGAGHEASAVLAHHLHANDWLHCHYRDKALMVARGLTSRQFMDALYCNDTSHSRGRQMSAHMSDPSLNVVSICGPVGNSALHAVGVAAAIETGEDNPVVLCSMGDGTTQEGEVLEAFAEAARRELPVLFFVGDNHWAISTPTTGETFYGSGSRRRNELFGMPIHFIDGRDAVDAEHRLGSIVAEMRNNRRPAVVVFDVERLSSHTNADDQSIYRTSDEIEASRRGDPLLFFERHLLRSGFSESDLQGIKDEVDQDVQNAQREAARAGTPPAVFDSRPPIAPELVDPASERRGEAEGTPLTMKDAMRDVLRHHLSTDGRVFLFGEDIEDPKGDVFGVTKGLSTDYPGRVVNSPLTESTIVGTSVGRALAGQRPIAFLQFADFLPLAYNQILAELASMHWRTDGSWQAPVVNMVPCGGYRPGLGPFHSHSLESVMTHIPGLDVFMPSTAADAAGLLNATIASGRPSVFFYPKSCLNDPQRATPPDVERQLVPVGVARRARTGRDVTFVAWGNTVRLCERVADSLESAGIESEILDLRSLSPWDKKAVLGSAEKTKKVIVVHEDNHTCGFGAEVLATIAEDGKGPIAVRRVTRADTFIPCNFENQIEVLPSFRRLMTVAAEMLELDLDWIAPPEQKAGTFPVAAIGSGPSDESVTVVELYVNVGDTVNEGDPIAALEATKSVFEFMSPVGGVVESIEATDGETIAVGQTLIVLKTEDNPEFTKAVTQEITGTPVLARRVVTRPAAIRRVDQPHRHYEVGISTANTITGSRTVENSQVVSGNVEMTSEEIIKRTGIERRFWVDDGEDAVSLGAKAPRQALDKAGLTLDDLSLIICSTTTPTVVTPSVACQVLCELSGQTEHHLPAYDINAACSGYLYALQSAYDFLQSEPTARVLVMTTEVLSPSLNPHDPDTVILFGDAASATILYGESHIDRASAKLHRPVLSGRGEDGSIISVPYQTGGKVRMRGQSVFREAVRAMISSLNNACEKHNTAIGELDLIVPHQANQRIIDAIQRRLGEDTPVFSNIREYGNTSSTSIPLCLSRVLEESESGRQIGLCAFGGGFTYGAALLETR